MCLKCEFTSMFATCHVPGRKLVEMPNPDPAKHKPTEAERDERVAIHTDLAPEEALALVLKVDPESKPVKNEEA